MRYLLFALVMGAFNTPAIALGDSPTGDRPPINPPDCSAMRCGISRDGCEGTTTGGDNVLLNTGDSLELINFGAPLMFSGCKGSAPDIMRFEILTPGIVDSAQESGLDDGAIFVPLLALVQPEPDTLCFVYYSASGYTVENECISHFAGYVEFDVKVGMNGRMKHRVKLDSGEWTPWFKPDLQAVNTNIFSEFIAYLFGL